MAKKAKAFTISQTEMKKLPRSEQRRFLDLGMVEGAKVPAEVAAQADAKAKPA
jgi:Fe2+ transport system protein FeoA